MAPLTPPSFCFHCALRALQFKAYKYEDRLFINPGSATGAYSPLRAQSRPSFVLMDVDGVRVRPRPVPHALARTRRGTLTAHA
jgi:hypothetical protein